MLIREQILKNKDKNILVEFGAKIHTHAKYMSMDAFLKLYWYCFKKKMLKHFSCQQLK